MHHLSSVQLLCILLFVTFLAACGGGGSSTTVTSGTTETVPVVVIDGYLFGATVCSDVNLNKRCDAGETSCDTDEDGKCELTGTDLGLYPLIVEVSATVTDDDTGLPVGKPYVMSAPIPTELTRNQAITPLTTLIQKQIEDNPNLDKEDAADLLKTQLGVSDDVDLFEDFVAQEGAEYDLLHAAARVIAGAMAEAQEQIEAAAEASGVIPDEQFMNSVLSLVMNNIMEQLTTIAEEVTAAQEAAGEEFDPKVLVPVVVEPPSVENIVEDLEAAAKPVVASSFQTILETGGHYWIEARIDYDGARFEKGVVTVDAGTNLLSEEMYDFDSEIGEWVEFVSDADSYLTADGWVESSEGAAGSTIAYNADQSATLTIGETGLSSTIKLTEKDLSGLSMRSIIGADAAKLLADKTLTFPAGAKAHQISFIPDQDQYVVESWMDGGIDHNKVSYWDQIGEHNITSLDEVLTLFAYSEDNYNSLWFDDISVQFIELSATTGTLKTFSSGDEGQVPEEDGSYEIITVAGKTLLMLNIPDQLKEYPAETTFLTEWSAEEGLMVKFGMFAPADSPTNDDDFGGNKIAYDALLANLNTSGVYPLWLNVSARNYEDSTRNKTQLLIGYLSNAPEDDAPLEIFNVEFPRSGTAETDSKTTQFNDVSYTLDCRDTICVDQGISYDTYLAASQLGEEYAAATYQFITNTEAGQTLYSYVDYPGHIDLPYISSDSVNLTVDQGGALLSWTLPTTAENWEEVDELRVVAYDPEQNKSFNIRLNASATEIALPLELMMGLSPASTFTLQTRAYTATGMNYARGTSNTIPVFTPPVTEFSTDIVADQTLYNVFSDGGVWEGITIDFAANGDVAAHANLTGEVTNDVLGTWTINEGILIIPEPEGTGYLKIIASEDDRLVICWSDTADGVDSCGPDDLEYLYFDATVAQMAVNAFNP